MTGNNPNLDIVNRNAYTKLSEILSIYSPDIKWKQLLTPIKGHDSVTNLLIMIGNNSNLDLVNINALTNF